MRKNIILIQFLYFPAYIFAQWQSIYIDAPVTLSTIHVSVVSPQVIWGATGAFLTSQGMKRAGFVRSTDGGVTWTTAEILNEPFSAGLCPNDMAAQDADNCWMVVQKAAGGGQLWRTKDGGVSWESPQETQGMIAAPDGYANGMYFFDAMHGVLLGDPTGGYYEIWTTSDGGDNWIRVPSGNIPDPLTDEAGVRQIYTVKNDTVWFGTTRGRIFRSTDRGLHWTASVVPLASGDAYISGVVFRDGLNGLAFSSEWDSPAYKTADGGLSWNYFSYSSMAPTKIAAFEPLQQLYLISEPFYLGTTGGDSYYLTNDATYFELYSCPWPYDYDFRIPGHGWAAGNELGYMYKWTGIALNETEPSDKTSIVVFPNPAQRQLTVNTGKGGGNSFNIAFTNPLGQIIREWGDIRADEKGVLELDLPESLPTGIYQITITGDNFQTSKPVMLRP